MTRLCWNLLGLFRCVRTRALGQRRSTAQFLRRNSKEGGWNCKRGLPYILRPPQHLKGRQRGKYSVDMERFLLFSSLPKYYSSFYFILFFFFTNNSTVQHTSDASKRCNYWPDMKEPPTSHMAALVHPVRLHAHTHIYVCVYKLSPLPSFCLWQHREVCVYREKGRAREH